MIGLHFDPVAHRYTLDGRELPSVTRILKLAGVIKTGAWFTDAARDRGTAFHRASELLDSGSDVHLTPLLADRVVAGRLEAYQKFLREQAVDVLAIEQIVACQTYHYAGCLDRRIRFRRTGETWLLDFKPNPASWHPLQLGAYARITGDTRCACLYVREDGTYKFKPYPMLGAAAGFLRHRLTVGETWRTTA